MGNPVLHSTAVQGKQPHNNQGQASPEKMRDDLDGRLPFPVSVLNGKRNGHAHAKQECREYQIGKSHHVFVHLGMTQPMGNVLDTGNVVDKQHQEHGQCTHGIDGGNTHRAVVSGRCFHRIHVIFISAARYEKNKKKKTVFYKFINKIPYICTNQI